LRINPRARRLIVRIAPGGQEIILVVPSRRAVKEGLDFAARQKRWIAARLAEQLPAIGFSPGARVPILGVNHEVRHAPQARAGVWLEAGAPPLLCVSGVAAHLPRRVTDFLKRRARAHLTERTRAHCLVLGAPMPRIALRDPLTRWGSCSPASGISYSWRLILAPDWVSDYVAAHEAAHLVHMNHSRAFWRLVAALTPNAKSAVRWLARDGRELHRYGA
jgi:hypothetical protein